MTATQPQTQNEQAPATSWLGYVAPMVVFLVLTYVEGQTSRGYVWLYIAKVCIVTGMLVAFRATWKQDIRFEARVLIPALIVGLAVWAEWVLIDPVTPSLSFLGKRVAYDPFTAIHAPGLRALFLAFRFFGLALMVPVMEELFWRSFLLRYLTDEKFTTVPMGTFSGTAFAIVAVAFGVAHPEWLAAIICAAAYALLLRQTRSLFACIVAHATTNLALGIYVLVSHQWHFW